MKDFFNKLVNKIVGQRTSKPEPNPVAQPNSSDQSNPKLADTLRGTVAEVNNIKANAAIAEKKEYLQGKNDEKRRKINKRTKAMLAGLERDDAIEEKTTAIRGSATEKELDMKAQLAAWDKKVAAELDIENRQNEMASRLSAAEKSGIKGKMDAAIKSIPEQATLDEAKKLAAGLSSQSSKREHRGRSNEHRSHEPPRLSKRQGLERGPALQALHRRAEERRNSDHRSGARGR